MINPEETLVDDFLDPQNGLKATFSWLKKWRKLIEISIIVVCAYNILVLTLFQRGGHGAHDLAYSFGLGLGSCIIATIIGTFVGVFVAILPLKSLPYYLKLPLSTLSGILLTNLLLALIVSLRAVGFVIGF